jgi:hypothetical protein
MRAIFELVYMFPSYIYINELSEMNLLLSSRKKREFLQDLVYIDPKASRRGKEN